MHRLTTTQPDPPAAPATGHLKGKMMTAVRTRSARLVALLATLALLAAACGGSEESPTGEGGDAAEGAATEPAAEPTDGGTEGGAAAGSVEAPQVALTSTTQPSYVNTRYGPNTYASDFGMDFTDENFTVFDSHATATQTALSGRADIVGGSLVSHMLVREAGEDFQVFCPFVNQDDFVLAGRGGADSVEDLFSGDYVVAVDSPGGAGDLILNGMLQSLDAPGTVADLPNSTVLESSGGRTTAFAADEAQITIIHLPQYNQAAAEIEDPVIIASLYEDVPVFIKEAFAAPASWLEENRDAAVAFCASIIRANQELPNDYDAFLEAVDTYVEEPPPDEELEEVFGLIQEYDFWPADGGMTPQAVEFMGEVAVNSGVLQEAPNPDELINREILDAAVEMANS
jgi:ABC-type nitrate/sulfonate/bicarbonate transport system substrate-binding protein